ncbi:OsmC family protein [Halomonas meridiana]|uniref:Peroxiredoxin n=1 Tax=Vreelandella aquamarina TaxID=77097 RepID=A0A857GL25_9GAMM|nr:OsmC family protein [Halomonas meridiana]MDP4558066.1 OsmC family protein [Halomonas meridiana]QHD49915.1 peroxiredoxin [Halomonas meridiana]HBM29852.1 peroxiredoxin [Halomonas sp.]|tara:strand:+ start:46 stop:453 length:408 start_codon:yes stop_codon:yes gene_type:complete
MHPPIVVISERNSAFRQRVEVNGMDDLFADVPTVVGGDESAPDPHDYFDIALGTCKAITVQMYAKRKQWPLEGITVKVQRDDSGERQGLYKLDVTLELHGISDPEQRAKLEEISHRCPIQRLMTQATIEIATHTV